MLCVMHRLGVSLSVTCEVLGSSMKNRLSSFLVETAAGASAGGGAAPGFSATQQHGTTLQNIFIYKQKYRFQERLGSR